MANSVEKAAQFRALHTAQSPLILYNIWDVASAKAVENAGAAAIATGSDSVAAAQGYADGENMPFADLVALARRLANNTSLPVSIDMEAGYAEDINQLSQNVAALISAGVVGINIEDQIVGTGRLRPVAENAARLAGIRRVADQQGVSLFINARCDTFLASLASDHAALMPDAVARAHAYHAAGADGVFIPLLTDTSLVAAFVGQMAMPVNSMAVPGGPTTAQWQSAGVARISHGPFPLREAMAQLTKRAREAFPQ